MLDIERGLRQEGLLKALTGLNRKAFEALIPEFSKVYEQTTRQTQPRRRALGGGRAHSIADD